MSQQGAADEVCLKADYSSLLLLCRAGYHVDSVRCPSRELSHSRRRWRGGRLDTHAVVSVRTGSTITAKLCDRSVEDGLEAADDDDDDESAPVCVGSAVFRPTVSGVYFSLRRQTLSELRVSGAAHNLILGRQEPNKVSGLRDIE